MSDSMDDLFAAYDKACEEGSEQWKAEWRQRILAAVRSEPTDINKIAAAMADPLIGEVVAGMLAVGGIDLQIRRPVVTNVGPDQQDRAHELAHEHAAKVAEAVASVALDHDPDMGTHYVGDDCPGGHR